MRLVLLSFILAGCTRSGCHTSTSKIKTVGEHQRWTDTYGVLLESGAYRKVQAPVVGMSVAYAECAALEEK